MEHDEAAKVIARLTYVPGWWFKWYRTPPPDTANVLRFGAREPDVEDPQHPSRDVVLTETVPDDQLKQMGERELLIWIREVVRRRVLHEVDEWLRIDGRPLVEPHPEKFNRGVLRVAP